MKNILQWLVIITIVVYVLIPNNASAADSKSFRDVSNEFWAHSDIGSMAKLGYLDGYEDGTFRPNQKVTREEFAKVLVASFGLDPTEGPSSFSDVDSTRWSVGYIEASKSFISYYSGPTGRNMFKPDEDALREDVAVALVKALNLTAIPSKTGVLDKFKDKTSISPKIKDYVAVAIETGLINGFEDGTFRGSESLTRAQAAALLNRAIKTAGETADPLLQIIKFEPSVIDPNVIIFEGKTHPDAKVTANNLPIDLEKDGSFTGTYRFRLSGEKVVNFVAKNSFDKSATVTKRTTIDIKKPEVFFDAIPDVVDRSMFNVTGIVKNAVFLKIGDNVVDISSNNRFSTKVNLIIGENELLVELRDAGGIPMTSRLNITYAKPLPTVTVTSAIYSMESTYTLTGIVQDPYTSVYVNDQSVHVNSDKKFSKIITLSPGINVLNIVGILRVDGDAPSSKQTFTVEYGK